MKHFHRKVASPFQATIAGLALAAGLLAAPAAQASDVSLSSYLKCRSTQLTQFPGTIVDAAVATPELSTLVSLVQAADLVGPLAGKGPLTVFAPTNAAFEALLGELGITAEELLGQPQLADVLLYHVVSGAVLSTDLQNGMTAETLGGQSITVDLTDGVKINKSAVEIADIQASNGVIHVIDSVLIPETFELVR